VGAKVLVYISTILLWAISIRQGHLWAELAQVAGFSIEALT